jgi:hypothetical protein
MATGGVQGVQEFEESKGKEPVKRIGVSGVSAYVIAGVRKLVTR